MTHRLTRLVLALLVAVPAIAQLPRPDHIVVVIEENKDVDDIIGKTADAPYLNQLAASGSLLTDSHGLHHPSQPNYLELFAGDAQGVCNDDCPQALFATANLANALAKKDPHLSFTGYAEDLPADHATCVTPKIYGRKHCPWLDFTTSVSLTKDFQKFPTTPEGFKHLPTVSFVIPNLVHDMHNLPDGKFVPTSALVHNGDTWLKAHLKAYADWALKNNSLLIVTWDEDGTLLPPVGSDCEHAHPTTPPDNRIVTIIVGEHVKKGPNPMTVTHLNLLRTIEDMYGVPPIGQSASVPPITGSWQ